MHSKTPVILPAGCIAFGSGATALRIENWIKNWNEPGKIFDFLLVLAGSQTAEVEGISAAGATPASRRYTAIADAELLLNGPLASRNWPLPPLPAGVSPALISYVASRFLDVKPLVIPVGLSQEPPFPYLGLEDTSLGPAACLSSGKAMNYLRVQDLWRQGLLIGRKLRRPLLLAECVPGGTTTAQAVLTGLGFSVADLISGSIRNPPIALKKAMVERGLLASGLDKNPEPKRLLAAVGDPFQPLAVGLLLGAREAGQQVLLGGGGQMLAVLALALSELTPSKRNSFSEGIVLGTTAWLASESIASKVPSALVQLMDRIGNYFGVELLGISSGLRFDKTTYKVLYDYELGYVKEGVGAGALALIAQLQGASCKDLVDGCENAVEDLQRLPA